MAASSITQQSPQPASNTYIIQDNADATSMADQIKEVCTTTGVRCKEVQYTRVTMPPQCIEDESPVQTCCTDPDNICTYTTLPSEDDAVTNAFEDIKRTLAQDFHIENAQNALKFKRRNNVPVCKLEPSVGTEGTTQYRGYNDTIQDLNRWVLTNQPGADYLRCGTVSTDMHFYNHHVHEQALTNVTDFTATDVDFTPLIEKGTLLRDDGDSFGEGKAGINDKVISLTANTAPCAFNDNHDANGLCNRQRTGDDCRNQQVNGMSLCHWKNQPRGGSVQCTLDQTNVQEIKSNHICEQLPDRVTCTSPAYKNLCKYV